MKNYVFYTNEGFTHDPQNNHIENCQILGWSKGNTSKEAFGNFKRENYYLLKYGFSEIICQQLAFGENFVFSLNDV